MVADGDTVHDGEADVDTDTEGGRHSDVSPLEVYETPNGAVSR